ncbi:MAG: glycosyltransferase [Pseudomonadota bacterium]
MRILFVSNGNFKHLGERAHCFEARMRNGFIRNNHHVYFFSDRDTARELGLWGKITAKRRVNNKFIEICRNFKPDFIMLGQADYIKYDALQEVRSFLPDVKIAAYCIDIILSPHIIGTIHSKLPALDAVFCTTAGPAIRKAFKKSKNIKVTYIPNPCDSSIDYIRAEQRSDQKYDVFWAMRGYRHSYDGDPRFSIARNLDTHPDIAIDYYGYDNKPVLMGRNYYEAISNCKGGLNISVQRLNERPTEDHDALYLYSSDRISHYFGCGLLTYIKNGHKLDELFTPDKHAVYFDDIHDLTEKILYFKDNDDARVKIATEGANYYRKHFNEQKVAGYIIDVTFNASPQSDYKWHREVF